MYNHPIQVEASDSELHPGFIYPPGFSAEEIDNRHLQVRLSTIPDAGNGLFAKLPFEKNAIITYYGGELIDRRDALFHRPEHLCSTGFGGPVFDGSLHISGGMKFDPAFFLLRNALASFANSPVGTCHKANAKYVHIPTREEDLLDCQGKTFVPYSSIVLKALRRIERGEEIFVNYGPSHPATKMARQKAAEARLARKLQNTGQK